MARRATDWILRGADGKAVPIEIPEHVRIGEAKVRLVALVLADYADDRTLITFPGRATIADETGLHRRDVDVALDVLTAHGWLERVPGAAGPGKPRRFRFTGLPLRAGDARHDDDENAPGMPGTNVQERAGERAGDARQDPDPDHEPDPDALISSVVERIVAHRAAGKPGRYRMAVRRNILGGAELDDIRRACTEAGTTDIERIVAHHERHRARYDAPTPHATRPSEGSMRALDVGSAVLAAGGQP